MFFFFQAEDGIRDSSVTGVQTCALPIWSDLVSSQVQFAAAKPPPPGFTASDPGVRGDPAGGGGPIGGLTANQQAFFDSGLADFVEAEDIGNGLGPRMNLDS